MTDIKTIVNKIKTAKKDAYYPFELFQMAGIRNAEYEHAHLDGIAYVMFVEGVLTQDEYTDFTSAAFPAIMAAVAQLREE